MAHRSFIDHFQGVIATSSWLLGLAPLPPMCSEGLHGAQHCTQMWQPPSQYLHKVWAVSTFLSKYLKKMLGGNTAQRGYVNHQNHTADKFRIQTTLREQRYSTWSLQTNMRLLQASGNQEIIVLFLVSRSMAFIRPSKGICNPRVVINTLLVQFKLVNW